jgi:hypothetical protein
VVSFRHGADHAHRSAGSRPPRRIGRTPRKLEPTLGDGAYKVARLGNDAVMTFSEALPETDEQIQRYVGMDLMAARAEAEAAGWAVVRLLEEHMPRTMDYRSDRINLTTDGTTDRFNASSGTGIVIEVDNG